MKPTVLFFDTHMALKYVMMSLEECFDLIRIRVRDTDDVLTLLEQVKQLKEQGKRIDLIIVHVGCIDVDRDILIEGRNHLLYAHEKTIEILGRIPTIFTTLYPVPLKMSDYGINPDIRSVLLSHSKILPYDFANFALLFANDPKTNVAS